jgi:ring-1,2-phenylacetyl-CoA epoxidase subunit PaaE
MAVAFTSGIYSRLTIKAIITETAGFKTFVFEDDHGIQYEAGQFLTIVQMIRGEEVRRSYSITSSPALGEPLSIGIKRIDNGIFSRTVFDQAQPGDVWWTTGAAGFFCLPKQNFHYHSIFFFAAGSGITPIFSLLKTVLQLHPQVKIVLVYSNHDRESTIFFEALKRLQQSHPQQLFIEFIFSNNPDLTKAHLNRDLMTTILKTYAPTIQHSLFYTCGPEAFMRMVIYQLQEWGFPKEHIKKEDFVLNRAPLIKRTPPDTEPHLVSLKIKGGSFQFKVQYPDTILGAAKKEGIALPYSCETGRCGSCAARCTQGTVWLAANEVRTENDLSGGLTLTCVGYPVGGDVVLSLL